MHWEDEDDEIQSEAQVYTLGSTSRRNVINVPDLSIEGDAGKFVNGFLHWLNMVDEELHILSFDLEHEEFGVVGISEDMILDLHFSYLGLLKGCLSIIDCSLEDTEIWMKDYNVKESWTRLFSIKVTDDGAFYPFAFRKNGEVLLMCNRFTVFSYNPETEECKRLEEDGPIKFAGASRSSYEACSYTGSIISLEAAHSLKEQRHCNNEDNDQGYGRNFTLEVCEERDFNCSDKILVEIRPKVLLFLLCKFTLEDIQRQDVIANPLVFPEPPAPLEPISSGNRLCSSEEADPQDKFKGLKFPYIEVISIFGFFVYDNIEMAEAQDQNALHSCYLILVAKISDLAKYFPQFLARK
ncbi:hypothetical protein GIB67_009579 [Kingdonia uniflora]|uniref:F-box associated beta-propeller type 3 domain-containing protein n=1 Tax=Kingdonia uniflora TaxID=39325 RepID=A0A7J7LX62_9MAGN|nr:hypothetical protein GIB67_009579 [Kingdonia uniflora]